MDDDSRVGHTDAINNALLKLFVEQRSLPHIDADIHLGRAYVVQALADSHFLFVN